MKDPILLGRLHGTGGWFAVYAEPDYGVTAPGILVSNGAASVVANHISVGVSVGEYERWEPVVPGLDWTADEQEMMSRLRAAFRAANTSVERS